MSRLKRNRYKAAKHLASLHSGEALSPEQYNLDGWQSEDKDYQAEYKGMAYLQANMEDLAKDPEITQWKEEPVHTYINSLNNQARRKKYLSLSVAASLLLVAIIYVSNQYWLTSGALKVAQVAQHFTPIGQTKTVELTDGSVITLNSGSLVSVDFDKFRRYITLERGEAYFDVVHDNKRPFTVNLGARSVTVLGTKFNLRRSLNEFTLAVTEGKVAVHLSGETLQENAPVLTAPKGEQIELKSPKQHHVKAGWVAKYNLEENKLAGHISDNVERYHDWRDGMIDIDGEPLFNVIKELNRYSRKKIMIEDPGVIDLKMYGVLRTDNINKTLVSIEKALPIKVVNDFDRIIITADKNNLNSTEYTARDHAFK